MTVEAIAPSFVRCPECQGSAAPTPIEWNTEPPQYQFKCARGHLFRVRFVRGPVDLIARLIREARRA